MVKDIKQTVKQSVVVNIHDKTPKKPKKKRKPRKKKADVIQGLIPGTGGPGGFRPSIQTLYRPLPNYNPYAQFYSGPAFNNFDAITSAINENLKTISKTNLLTAQQDEQRKKENLERTLKELELTEELKQQKEKFEEGGHFLYSQIKDLKKELNIKNKRENKQPSLVEAPTPTPFYSPAKQAEAAEEPEPAEELVEEDEPEEEGSVMLVDSPALEGQSKEITNQILNASSNSAFEFPNDEEIMMPSTWGKTVFEAVDEEWKTGTGPRAPKIKALRDVINNSIDNARKKSKDALIIAKYRKEVFDRYLKTKK